MAAGVQHFNHFVPAPVLVTSAGPHLENTLMLLPPMYNISPITLAPPTPFSFGIPHALSPMPSPVSPPSWPPPQPQARSPTPKPAIDRKIHHATDPGLQRLLFKKGSGVLKKVSPNSYMLYRLDHIKSYKGKKISANDINAYITNEWNSLPQEVKNVYKLRSAVLQDLLDKLNYKSNLAEAATSPASSDLMAAPKLESLALPSRMERAYYLAP
ncbi:hypothetical protein IWQ57_000303 [Coemansia nantahalensis]|uniref:Uncharacterized protein n=1 Tax=Coemansia nantahalensis TaxID=2789366 RepID=A0ACC1K895_9FUNG|nr:hypothetical protein IWQ57_000303 [Coemansia nantahalensis]